MYQSSRRRFSRASGYGHAYAVISSKTPQSSSCNTPGASRPLPASTHSTANTAHITRHTAHMYRCMPPARRTHACMQISSCSTAAPWASSAAVATASRGRCRQTRFAPPSPAAQRTPLLPRHKLRIAVGWVCAAAASSAAAAGVSPGRCHPESYAPRRRAATT